MNNAVKNLSYSYADLSIRLYKKIISRKEFVLSKQFLKSATSVGAQVREAQNAESRADFIHKLAIGQKECDESLYWLELMHNSRYITNTEFKYIYPKGKDLLKLIRSIIISTKNNS
ncbi:MAG: four helix bundle protein [Candidatus Marinimicrobia bacterium]|nr:four helix bundle protein [Candidatus Neomarinimicrobiota bacterium]